MQWEKSELVQIFKEFLPEFVHEEKGKDLDQKCKMQRIFDITFSLLAIIFFFASIYYYLINPQMTGEGEILFFQKELEKI